MLLFVGDDYWKTNRITRNRRKRHASVILAFIWQKQILQILQQIDGQGERERWSETEQAWMFESKRHHQSVGVIFILFIYCNPAVSVALKLSFSWLAGHVPDSPPPNLFSPQLDRMSFATSSSFLSSSHYPLVKKSYYFVNPCVGCECLLST